MFPSTKPQYTVSNPTYNNSYTSISKPIKPFESLDHNYTQEENLQHIEARVRFSLGYQPTSDIEYKFWHARRMAFIQCFQLVQFLVGTFVYIIIINKIGTIKKKTIFFSEKRRLLCSSRSPLFNEKGQ